jgi:hypothetical protein
MALKPMLSDLELEMVEEVESDQDRVLAHHPVPALEGDFLQELGRRATTITLTGVLAGEEVADELKRLREKFRAAETVPFVADIATATRVDDVLIEEMGVRELAGRTQVFEYAFTLRELIPPPPPETEPPPVIPPPPIEPETGTLEVEVIVEGRTDFDFSTVNLTVDGTQADGTPLPPRTLTNRTRNLWTEKAFPPGTYTARAVVVGPPAMRGEVSAEVKPGQLTHVTIVLRPGAVTNIAQVFVVHFHFDKAFVEPCMRAVLEQVAQRVAANADEHLVIVGQTDLTGSTAYNQSLSERRARSVFAFLTSGIDAAGARREWDELRKTRPTGTTLSLNDSWGRREVQWILQDLRRYRGNIDTETPRADDAALTDAAVKQFQSDHGLTPDGIVGDQTWAALIDDYLNVNPLSVAPERFLPNKKDGCDGGPLKWLGTSELDPVIDTEQAERKNRRTELLFVRSEELPADVKQPDTFALPAPGAVSPQWCLNASNTTTHACFVRPRIAQPKEQCTTAEEKRFDRTAAEPGDVTVSGTITFEDGTPLPDTPFVLFAPEGTILTGEHRDGPLRGWAIAVRTGPNGEFAMTAPGGAGVYTIEIRARVIARMKGAPISDAKGNVVCARLKAPNSTLDIVVTSLAAASVTPTITLSSPVVVVRKPGINPRRQECRLGASPAFTGSGTFTRSSDAVRFFDAAVGGNEITFNGTDNVFSDAQLLAGVTLFTEGARASAALDDVGLQLALTVGGQPGLGATAKMTAVELTLDICVSRTAANVDPAPLPPATKVNPGRFVQAALADFRHERAMVIVRQPTPAAFAGELTLAPVNASVTPFATEVAAAGQVALPNPQVIATGTIPADGLRFFAEGVNPSALAADSGLLLGIRNVEPEGDRVAVTVGQLDVVDTATAAAPVATFVRVGLWDNAFDAAGNVLNTAVAANNFVGADTRQFFLRLRDASRAGTGNVNVEWRTLAENGDEFFTPADRRLTLIEDPATAGVFLSQSVMLVTDDDDQNQGTHSGLPAALPDGNTVRARGQSNHRLRRANVRADLVAEYPHPATAGVRVARRAPVFNRNPESRRRLPLQIFVLRVAPGGAGVVPTAPGSAIWTRDMRVAEETYARFGIEVQTVVAPGTAAANVVSEQPFIQNETVRLTGPNAFVLLRPPVIVDPRNRVELRQAAGGVTNLTVVQAAPNPGEVRLDLATGRLTLHASQIPRPGDRVVASYVAVGHRAVLTTAPAGVNPLAVRFAPINDESAIGAANPAQANTIRVFYTGGLASGNRGESWPDVDFAGQPQVGGCFIDGASQGPYTVTHEAGHVLTDKTGGANTGHYVQAAAPPGNRLFTNQNLMRNGTSPAEGVNQSKRIWDNADVDGVNQFAQIIGRPSRFLRNF